VVEVPRLLEELLDREPEDATVLLPVLLEPVLDVVVVPGNE
jgi:hypothetical protein